MVLGVNLRHVKVLLTSNPKYPVDYVGMPTGSRVSNQDNLFLRQLPKCLSLGLWIITTLVEIILKNPFHFQDYDINFGALYVDGEQLPAKLLQPDFKGGNCIRKYMNLVQMAGKPMKDHSLLISHEKFTQRYTLFALGLSPNQECAAMSLKSLFVTYAMLLLDSYGHTPNSMFFFRNIFKQKWWCHVTPTLCFTLDNYKTALCSLWLFLHVFLTSLWQGFNF